MWKIIPLLMCVGLLMGTGCTSLGLITSGSQAGTVSTTSPLLSQLGKLDVDNLKVTRVLAKDLLSTWRANSGVIRGFLGNKIDDLPAGIVAGMNELDTMTGDLYTKFLLWKEDPANMGKDFRFWLDVAELDDLELFRSLGTRGRLLWASVRQALLLYAPDIASMIPSLLAL